MRSRTTCGEPASPPLTRGRRLRRVFEGQLVDHIPETGRCRVALRRSELDVRPSDSHFGIVVSDSALDRLVVIGVALVHDVGELAGDAETMRESDRAVELAQVPVV